MPDLTHPLDAARHWQGIHYRHHDGEMENCTSKMCQRALDVLTAPSVNAGSGANEANASNRIGAEDTKC